jgi:hypothetical protein
MFASVIAVHDHPSSKHVSSQDHFQEISSFDESITRRTHSLTKAGRVLREVRVFIGICEPTFQH